MPRENSFSDSDGASLTSEEDFAPRPTSPTYSNTRHAQVVEPVSPVHAPRSETGGAHLLSSPSKYSVHSRKTIQKPGTNVPNARFKAVVRKVMHMHRGAFTLSRNVAGAEPGIDPRRASADLQYSHIRQNCVIEMYDYSAVRSSYGRMTNNEFVNLMYDEKASQPESWVKVRWINIAGISWDVIKAISLKYEVHPLALEDVFHARSQTHSKADYYSKHLFLRFVVHELGDPDALPEPTTSNAAVGSTLVGMPRSTSPLPFTEDDDENIELKASNPSVDDQTVYGTLPKQKNSKMSLRRRNIKRDVEQGASMFGSTLALLDPEAVARKRAREEEVAISALKRAGDSVNVKVYPMFIFLFRDGTIISMNSKPESHLTSEISHRLHHRDTVLRQSADPSMLVQSLLDMIVDKGLEVIDEYQSKIKKFERAILVRPKIRTVRALHILNGDLILHKRTMEPLKTVVYGLRRYDSDRCAALVEDRNPDVKVVGYMSHKSKIYLADVYDHVQYMLTSLDMFADISQNLIDYTFNMTSYDMNQDMRKLTLATIICLPLTLLTGYFGMNFEPFWAVNKHSDLLFWEIALPVMAVVMPIFLMQDIKRMVHYVHKKMIAKKAIRMYES